MARLAPVVPISIARTLQVGGSKDHLGGYHLLLAHDILDKPEDYKEVYGKVRAKYPDSFLILDNSIVELGKAMGIKDLIAASKVLEPDCVVVPDVMGDGAATRENAVKFHRQYITTLYEEYGENGPEVPALMGVLQGDNVDDAMETLAVFYALPMIEYIGIPRILVKMHGSRMPTLCAIQRSPAFVKTRRSFGSFQGYHLLGFSDDILDDVACARMPWVQGIDSAVPIRAGLRGIKVDLSNSEWSELVGPRGDFWQQSLPPGGIEDISVRWNLDKYRGWINGR